MEDVLSDVTCVLSFTWASRICANARHHLEKSLRALNGHLAPLFDINMYDGDDGSAEPLLTRTVVTLPSTSTSLPPAPLLMKPPRTRQIWPLLVLLILVHLSTVLYTLPLNRVIELRLCQEHYALHEPGTAQPIPEKLCKIDPVQSQLAWLQGVMETTLVLCGTCDVM
jgi:hypothetical protein